MFISDTPQHAPTSEPENVESDQDSDDGWNYYRIDSNKKESVATAVTAATDKSGEGIEEQRQDLETGPRGDSEIQSSKVEADIKCEGSEEKITLKPISIDVNIIYTIVFL